MTNELLRAHVTRVGFNLQLTKNQIAELVWLHVVLSDPRTVRETLEADDSPRLNNTIGRHLLTNGLASRNALMTRGLIVHHAPPKDRNRDDRWLNESMRDRYSITTAGRAVVELLKDSGLWDEVAAEIPWVIKPAPRPEYTTDEEIQHLRARLEQAATELKKMRAERDAEKRRAIDDAGKRAVAERKLYQLQKRVRDMVEAADLVGSDAA